jgi:hypothetical protein
MRTWLQVEVTDVVLNVNKAKVEQALRHFASLPPIA